LALCLFCCHFDVAVPGNAFTLTVDVATFLTFFTFGKVVSTLLTGACGANVSPYLAVKSSINAALLSPRFLMPASRFILTAEAFPIVLKSRFASYLSVSQSFTPPRIFFVLFDSNLYAAVVTKGTRIGAFCTKFPITLGTKPPLVGIPGRATLVDDPRRSPPSLNDGSYAFGFV